MIAEARRWWKKRGKDVSVDEKRVYVDPYVRADGVHVAGYWREGDEALPERVAVELGSLSEGDIFRYFDNDFRVLRLGSHAVEVERVDTGARQFTRSISRSKWSQGCRRSRSLHSIRTGVT